MAKKKTLRQKIQWSREDSVELLAWVDHTINHDEIDFSKTIIDHLKESRRKEYTLTQIENKLRGLWTNYCSQDAASKGVRWREDVFKNGSSSLVGLSPDEKRDTASTLEGLEDGYNARHPFPARRLRSRSRPASNKSHDSPSLELAETGKTKRSRRSKERAQTLSLTPSTIKSEKVAVERALYRTTSSGKRKRATPIQRVIHLTRPEQLSPTPHSERIRNRYQASQATTPHTVQIVHDSEDEEEQRCMTRSLGPENIEQLVTDTDSTGPPRDEYTSGGTKHTLSKVNNPNVTAEIAEIRRLQEQLRQKDSEIQELQRSTTRLQAEVELLQSVQSQRDEQDGEPYHARIAGKDKFIKELQQELNEREFLGTFTKILPASRAWFGETNGGTDVVAGFQYINSECKQILYRHESSTATVIPPLDGYESLRSLVCSGLGLDPDTPLRVDKTILDLSKLSLQAVVRALTTCAVRDWIFESDFPSFNSEKTNILAKYREHLARQDGANSLRKLDLAARNSLIKDHQFRRTLPDTAESFAMQLSRTLAPVFARNIDVPIEIGWDGFATWGQGIEECRERRIRLVNIFTKALEVKADSILNTVDYEMVIYPPGIQYDKNTMTVETMDGMAYNKDYQGCKVELCVEAAIYLYSKTELPDSAPVSEAIVTSRNFVHKKASERIGVKPIVKAVVILKDNP